MMVGPTWKVTPADTAWMADMPQANPWTFTEQEGEHHRIFQCQPNIAAGC